MKVDLNSTMEDLIEAINSGVQSTDDIIWQGSHKFEGNVDFNNANVTGLPSGGGGLTKTKVTLAELQALLTNDNLGMLVSIVFKKNVFKDFNHLFIEPLRVGYSPLSVTQPQLYKKHFTFDGENVSSLTFYVYHFYLTSAGFYLKKDTVSALGTITADKSSELTDANFDFYVYK